MTSQAAVDSIDVQILESFPVQVSVVARGHLPDGCTAIGQVEAHRSGNAVDVTVATTRPADALCTQALVPFEEVIPLDVTGLPGGTYTVNINGVSADFELAVDNVEPDELDEELSRECQPAEPGTVAYTSADLGFCLLYPAGYDQQMLDESELAIYIGSLLNATQPRVYITAEDAAGRDADQAAGDVETEFGAGFDLQRSILTLGGERAVQLTGVPGQDLSLQVFVVHGGRLYTLVFVPLEDGSSQSSALETLYATVVDSFRFLP